MRTKKINKLLPEKKMPATVRLNRQRILTKDSPFAVKEAYVQLRTNLMFSVAAESDEGAKVFMVTSANPSEGKSTTSSNIAVSFAMLGKRTLLLDCDMRKPNLYKLWKIQAANGISNLLTGIDKCYINEVEDLPLTVIPAGDIPPNPSELLSSSKFENAISFLKGKFDYIIIDTPPVNQVADAQIIAKCADGIVIVVSSGKTLLHELNYAQQVLSSVSGKICGYVLNGVDLKSGAYAYKKYGKYYASYGEHADEKN